MHLVPIVLIVLTPEGWWSGSVPFCYGTMLEVGKGFWFPPDPLSGLHGPSSEAECSVNMEGEEEGRSS